MRKLLAQLSALPASPAVTRLDTAGESAIEPLREVPQLNRAMYALSEAANHSVLWLTINWLNVARHPSAETAMRAARISAAIGAESLICNQGVKRLFNRERPPEPEARPHKLRRPQTSSFPSGHAASAACALFVLGNRRNLWWLGPLAALVGFSRAFVRVHHLSDVLAGFSFGAVVGLVFRRILAKF